ncbi:alpha-galactosidase [Tranquillimonas rosea]|uniref:Alpha-galactosidase n=1 Tax=Tranquillimonas rosea TaxID=641238 RepID=A0A1H9QX68_9RHOB|nr:alpha-galactosidase [Tranquillimonas rosea]SER65048.1 alpha-galactosidase [Tranquillimonas rosea]
MSHWRLDTHHQTLVFGLADGMPAALYWGPPLPADEDLAALEAAGQSMLTGGMLDALPPLTLCPEARRSFPGQPGLSLSRRGVPLHPKFGGCTAEAGAGTLSLTVTDGDAGLALTFSFEADADTGLITAATRLQASEPVEIHWLAAPVLPGPQQADEIVDIAGRWIGEFQLVRTPWAPGIRLREATTGRSGHEHPPFALFPDTGAGRTSGTVRAMAFGWSGGHRMIAEELPEGRRQIQWGHAAGSVGAQSDWTVGPLQLAVSAEAGMGGTAAAFQRHLYDRVVHWPCTPGARPVHYNCWEAVYFDHDLPVLSDIAERAAALGAERFVLDDGWFGRRDDDTSSLGDWQVDAWKYPDGLKPLIENVKSLGMSFGLWVEPEMVNRDSDLYRAHPDWALGAEDQIEGRGQRLLDMANPAVRDHLFATLDALLTANDIDYLKWDHNRVLPAPDAAQTTGIYDLLDRLRAAHPQVEIESCASGGGRIDTGILSRTHRVWLSDSNDALERLRMQHDAALFLPAAITGAHVGPRECHNSGRILPMSFRAWVAAQRHMGLEMDPREITPDEAETLKRVISWYKSTRAWRMAGEIRTLDSADPAVTAEMQIARDGDRFVLFAGQSRASDQTLPRPLRLTALQPDARYRLSLTNPEDLPRQAHGPSALLDGPLTLSGAALMQSGIRLPWSWPATMWVVEGERL